LESVDAKPIEKPRYNVPEPDIRKHEYILINEVEGIPCALIVCCDESGVQFYVDARTKKVVVRYQEDATEVNLPINRQEPRLTLLGAITLSNEALILHINLKGDNFRDTWIPPDIITGIHAEFSRTTNSYITIPVLIGWL
jgi:hypothetical protein